MLAFAKILWVKSVTLDEHTFAYGRRDPSVRAREPRRAGDVFDLHCTPEDAESLADPQSGDLLVLTQHDLATHLVQVIGDDVCPRPRRTIRPGTRDGRFSWQRTCSLIYLRDFEDAPSIQEAFGVPVDVSGGEVFFIPELAAIERSNFPRWAVQRRIAKALEPDRTQVGLTPIKEGPLRRLESGPGRVPKRPH